MNQYKNIITWILKIAVGIGSFILIYSRLKNDFTTEKLEFLNGIFNSPIAYCFCLLCIILIPVNWGIESYKWQQITKPIESISLSKAMQSVYAGICVGNLAPGRATEFFAKILFFKIENRPTIAMLHFANGMFQLAVTIVFGLLSLVFKMQQQITIPTFYVWLAGIFCIVLLIVFYFFIFNFNYIQHWILKKFGKVITGKILPYEFTKALIRKLFLYSLLRYSVFIIQFLLLLKLFYNGSLGTDLFLSICIYFLLTTALPMISFIEPAIRAAIALLVFTNLNIPEVALVITAVLLWLMNIVLPSIVGYIIIVKEKFEFSFFKK